MVERALQLDSRPGLPMMPLFHDGYFVAVDFTEQPAQALLTRSWWRPIRNRDLSWPGCDGSMEPKSASGKSGVGPGFGILAGSGGQKKETWRLRRRLASRISMHFFGARLSPRSEHGGSPGLFHLVEARDPCGRKCFWEITSSLYFISDLGNCSSLSSPFPGSRYPRSYRRW